MTVLEVFQWTLRAAAYSVTAYVVFVAALTIPFLQNQVIYLNFATQTWGMDLDVPEQWGFLRNQVTPFSIATRDGETLQAWHILPLELYRRYEEKLISESSGHVDDVTSRWGFHLLRDDPNALLVIYLHGAGGTLSSGWRPASYRGLYSGASDRIHTVAIDYRGFGRSTGKSSEDGLLTDAETLVDWAMNVAGIPASRIVIFGQSLGTAVSVSLACHMASRPTPVLFAGMVLVAPLSDVETLTATYRVAGLIPILSPVAYFPTLLKVLNSFIRSKWPSKDKIAELIRICEASKDQHARYHITIIHAEDDTDIPWNHSDLLYWHAVNASQPTGISYEAFEEEKERNKKHVGAAGWTVEFPARKGVVREEIIKYGVHDKIMSYPVVSLAVLRAFQSASMSS
ncbi:hypothetical protein H2203_004775 [Taxawa tesnikishii (nom. ined.)]|nr:hypothetical protein H2203_004775 [Dothideales sp. JES 119]